MTSEGVVVRDALIENLYAAAQQSGESLYALIDLASVPNGLRVLKLQQSPDSACLFEGTIQANAEAVAPWLLRIGNADSERRRLRDCVDAALTYPALSWIVTPLSLDELLTRLRRRLDARLPDSYDVLLRFYDPRVLPMLSARLHEPQQRAFFCVCSQWLYLDRDDKLQRIESVAAREGDILETMLELDANQQNALIAAAEIDVILNDLGNVNMQPFMEMTRTQRYHFAARQLAHTRDLKLEQPHEAMTLCMLALTLGEDFVQQPNWQAALDQVRERQITLDQAIEQMETHHA